MANRAGLRAGISIPILLVFAASWLGGVGAAAHPQNDLYHEDFEDGQAPGWGLEPGWQVQLDGSNHVLAGQGHVWARSNQYSDGDLRQSFRLKLIRGRIHAVVRLTAASRYFIGFDAEGTDLNKQYFPNELLEGLATKAAPHSLNRWYQIEVVINGSAIELYVDGARQWSYADPHPLTDGSFAFETLEDSSAYVDDIAVSAGAAQPTGPAAAAPPSTGAAPSTARLTWVRTGGPLGGLGYDVRMGSGHPPRMYVTDVWSGVSISTDDGLTWAPSNEGISSRVGDSGDAIPVFSLTIDPNNPDTIWAGTQYQRGIFKSTDAGQSWKKMDQGVVEQNGGISFRGFAVQQGDSNVVYAAAEISSWAWAGEERQGREFDLTKGVVYKTTDGGRNWKAAWRGDNLARYVWIDPRNPQVLYISTGIFDREAANSDRVKRLPGGEGVLKSIDGGQTWEHVNNGLNNLYVGSLFMNPRTPDVLLAGTGNNQYHEGSGVYLSEDGGQSWSQTLSDDIITSVEISTSNPNIAYAGSSSAVYRSTDGGRHWQQTVSGDRTGWGAPGVLAGFPIDLQADPRDPQRIFANEYGGGNFLSEDGGTTWQVASTGYTGAQVRGLAVDPGQPGRVIAAARSGIFVSFNGGEDWIGVNQAPFQAMEWTAVAIDPTDTQHIMAANNWWNEVAYSPNGGGLWSFSNALIAQGRAGWSVIAFAPSDPKIVYAGSAGYYSAGTFDLGMPGQGIWVNKDGTGKYWQAANTLLTEGTHVTGLAVDHRDAQRVLAATATGGILLTMDGGASWEERNQGLGSPKALSIAMDPANANGLLAGLLHGGTYRSSDGGKSWKSSSSGMPPEASVSSIVYDPTNSKVVYAADLFSGVYHSLDGGETWRPLINGLQMRSVNTLAISADGLHVYAGTEGGGVYRLDLNGQAPAIVAPPAQANPQPTAIAPQTQPTATPYQYQPAAPTTSSPFGQGFRCGTALLPFVLIGLLVWNVGRPGR